MNAATSPQPRWERRKDDRPGDLLAAALEQFVERGYAATRLDDVAAQAGVSKGTLYLYYPSKVALFEAVVAETVVPLIRDFEASIAASELSTPEMLASFFRHWWSHFGDTRLAGLAKLVIAESGNFPDVAQFFQREVIEPNIALLARLIERGMARGEFRAVDVEACIHIWMAPLVLRAVLQCSIESACQASSAVEPERFLSCHIEQILSFLSPANTDED